MGTTRKTSIIFLTACIVLTACSPAKHLPEGEKLYTGASVKLETGENVTAREKKVFRKDLQGLTRPRPNSRLLGIPIKLGIYNLFRKKKADSFWGRLRDRYGEPPVLLSSVDLEANVQLLENHLENKGFFHAGVTGDTTAKDKKGSAEYTATGGPRYLIDSLAFPDDSSALSVAIREAAATTLLKKGDAYDLDVIRGERTRMDGLLKEKGFYFFGPDYLLMRVDSTEGPHEVDIQVVVKAETPDEARRQYRINDVYIYSGYRIDSARLDTSRRFAQFHNGFYLVDRRRRFKPKMFDNIMMFQPGDLYNRTDHNQTLSRLINLNEFRFVRNRFEPLPDSAKLNAFYYLTPHPKKSLRGDFTVLNRSNNTNGMQLTLSWRNRNTFRAGEHLTISGYIGRDVQLGGGAETRRFQSFRTGAEANFAIPRFVIPFFDIKGRSGFVPRTNIQLGYDILNRPQLYTVNSFRGGLGYIWKESIEKSHEFYPVSINYVQPFKVSQDYYDSVDKYPYLRRVIDSQFIVGSTYQYNFNQLATGVQRMNSFYFNGLVDLSGNILGLLTGSGSGNGSDPKRIFNAVFDQYIKLEADARYYRRFGLNSTWANRLILGYGLPYGNSREIPYIKQFFTGGSNSIRAFRSRSLLGTYRTVDTAFWLPDLTGDLKLELNTEFRPKISGPIYGAVFIDAGNAWLKNPDPDRPGGEFGKDFLNQLAVGGGIGLRLDIQLFVIRLDVAIPLRKPWEQNPWVMRQIRFREPAWRQENIIYNLAIGYPF